MLFRSHYLLRQVSLLLILSAYASPKALFVMKRQVYHKCCDYGILIYLNRIEGAGATVCIEFDAQDITDSRIEELLKGIVITIEDVGNVDGPWEWEGEAFSASDAGAMAGAYTVNSQRFPWNGRQYA